MSTAADEVDDFDHVSWCQQCGLVLGPGYDLAVSFDCDGSFRQPELLHQALDGDPIRNAVFLSVDR